MKSNWHWLIPLAFLPSHSVWSEIVTDGSLTGTVQNVTGPIYTISPDLGKTVGHNIFHSFSQFNILQGETANFLAPIATDNIFTRVTGGSVSQINGVLNSASTANLWLINPAGWIIGKNASLNVNGALHFTAANALGFSDGGQFLADPKSQSSLSLAAPIDYQFTQGKQATITIDATDIVLKPGKDFSIVGGDIKLQESHISTPGGRILLGSNSGAGQWQENLTGLNQISGARGNIDISHTASTTIRNPTLVVNQTNSGAQGAAVGGGSIQLVSKNLNLKNAYVSALAQDDQKSGSISLDAENTVLDATTLSTSTRGSQNAGPIAIRGGNLTLTGISQPNTTTGNIDQIGSFIKSDTAIASTGQSGLININLNGVLRMAHSSSISSQLLSSGNGGAININANVISMDQGSGITVATGHDGNAGNINIQSELLDLARNSYIASSANRRLGNAGDITIASNNLHMQNFSAITSVSTKISSGRAGNITLTSRDPADGNSSIQMRQSFIGTNLTGIRGDGGNINVNTSTLILNGGFIQANSAAKDGRGGNVAVTSKRSLFSSDQLVLGTDVAHVFEQESNTNVIQAAAPQGNSGSVRVSQVGLYLAGQLNKIDTIFASNRPIADDPCTVGRGAEVSSLVQLGNGGLAPNASDTVSLPLQRYLQNSLVGTPVSAADTELTIALYTPNHLCSEEHS